MTQQTSVNVRYAARRLLEKETLDEAEIAQFSSSAASRQEHQAAE